MMFYQILYRYFNHTLPTKPYLQTNHFHSCHRLKIIAIIPMKFSSSRICLKWERNLSLWRESKNSIKEMIAVKCQVFKTRRMKVFPFLSLFLSLSLFSLSLTFEFSRSPVIFFSVCPICAQLMRSCDLDFFGHFFLVFAWNSDTKQKLIRFYIPICHTKQCFSFSLFVHYFC